MGTTGEAALAHALLTALATGAAVLGLATPAPRMREEALLLPRT
jgi:hypothetical protein